MAEGVLQALPFSVTLYPQTARESCGIPSTCKSFVSALLLRQCRDLLDDPEVASLSCIWALSLLLSPSTAADYLLPYALRPMLAYISNGGFWNAPMGPQVLTDLRDSLTPLGELRV